MEGRTEHVECAECVGFDGLWRGVPSMLRAPSVLFLTRARPGGGYQPPLRCFVDSEKNGCA